MPSIRPRPAALSSWARWMPFELLVRELNVRRDMSRTPLYQAVRKVPDYNEDPVSRVYEEFYSSAEKRTCGKCGHVAQRPA